MSLHIPEGLGYHNGQFWNVANPSINAFLPDRVMLMGHLKPHLCAMFELGLRIRFWSEFFEVSKGRPERLYWYMVWRKSVHES